VNAAGDRSGGGPQRRRTATADPRNERPQILIPQLVVPVSSPFGACLEFTPSGVAPIGRGTGPSGGLGLRLARGGVSDERVESECRSEPGVVVHFPPQIARHRFTRMNRRSGNSQPAERRHVESRSSVRDVRPINIRCIEVKHWYTTYIVCVQRLMVAAGLLLCPAPGVAQMPPTAGPTPPTAGPMPPTAGPGPGLVGPPVGGPNPPPGPPTAESRPGLPVTAPEGVLPSRPSGSGDGLIYGSEFAERLVQEARSFDPQSSLPPRRDRDLAISLYQQAIEAQPGAKVNAVLANRIAQLYNTFADKARGVYPRPDKAAEWWRRCLEFTDPTQLLWSQAQMGLASTTVMQRNPESAAAFYDQILAVDSNTIQLENWKRWGAPQTDEEAAALRQELERIRQQHRELQAKVRQMKSYAERLSERKTHVLEARENGQVSRATRRVLMFVLSGLLVAATLLVLRYRQRKLAA